MNSLYSLVEGHLQPVGFIVLYAVVEFNYIYANTKLGFLYFPWVFPIYETLNSTTYQKQILYVLFTPTTFVQQF